MSADVVRHLMLDCIERCLVSSAPRTMIARKAREAPAELALAKAEMGLLDRAVLNKSLPAGLGTTAPGRTLSAYLAKVARLGGYLARTRDPAGARRPRRGLCHPRL